MTSMQHYIKFNADWVKEAIDVDPARLAELNRVRSELMARGWIGALPDGVGFGNISLRLAGSDKFLITGSATGHLPELDASHLALVETTDMKNNRLSCRGLTIASSESLSQAACYLGNPHINAVIHIHDHERWEKHRQSGLTTPDEAAFGTPELAFAILDMIKRTKCSHGFIVMGGHPDGILAFGEDLQAAVGVLLRI